MMPILTSVIAGEDKNALTPMRGFKLSLTYVLGMALVYALLGSLMGALGAHANVSMWLQKPPVIIASAALFVVLALSMFGWFTLQLPVALQNRLNQLSSQQKGGRMLGAFIMGAISALVVSPCVSAPLVGVLGFISTTGNAVMGAVALFALGLGMGIPLIVLGITGGKFLPKAGAWMNAVKGVFGIGLLAVAIGLLERLLPPALTMALWAVLCAGSAVWMGAFAQAHTRVAQVLKALGLLVFAYALALLVGAWAGQTNPFKPLGFLSSAQINAEDTDIRNNVGVPFKTITTIDELNVELARAKQAAKPVVLDLAADWCTSCKVMERTTFMDAQVVARLSHYTALRLDITDTNAAHSAWMQTQGIFGPPVVQFYDAQGNELKEHRVTGEANASEFLEKIPQ
jgi:thiol:disulfide interchange protein DsbD